MNFLLNTSVADLIFFEKLSLVFSNYSIVRDTFDIIVLAFVFYFAFRFLRSRKTIAIFIGIAVCLLIITLANFFELKALSKVFEALVSGGPVLIVIIFHTEIRDALERIGAGSIKGIMTFSDRKKKKELYISVIDNICTAVTELSKECTGALIVYERTTRLSDIVSTGVAINADVSSSLLRNLFYNKAPLHDGAVVISEGRIAAAGCFLPLSRRNDLNTDLGTRHRAAIGMSESSDALIIVVSEETGTISVACDCSLVREFTPDELRTFLLDNIVRSSCNVTE